MSGALVGGVSRGGSGGFCCVGRIISDAERFGGGGAFLFNDVFLKHL